MDVIDNHSATENSVGKDLVRQKLDKLSLKVDDDFLLRTITQRINVANAYFEDLDLTNRQNKNREYFLGKQIDKEDVPEYSLPYLENLVWEGMYRNTAIAISRLPDLQAKPGNDSEQSRQTAELVTQIINSDLRKRDNKKVLKLAYQQRKVYLFSVVKAVWNKQKKDYEFINVHPQKVTFDHTVKTNDVDKMSFVAESIDLTVEQLISKFPSKKQDIYDELGWHDGQEDKASNLATPVSCTEVWFDEMAPVANENGEKKWTKISAVVWKFKNLILKKIKNPYFDWEGDQSFFDIKEKEDAAELPTEDDVFESLFGPMDTKTIYRNHFNFPKKPYYLMAFNLFGENPIDISNDMEQIIPFQDQINKEGRQIYDMNARSKPKLVLSTDGLDKKTAENMDTNNPNESIVIDGDPKSMYGVIQTPPASRQIYDSIARNRSIALEMWGLGETTRGISKSGEETLGAKQMMREQDFGLIDDEVDDTINACGEWMASWAMQMIRRFYTKDKMIKLKGKKGEIVFQRINQDLIEDGMEVVISASGVDKQKRMSQAFEMARMKLIDPYTFFKDIGASDPEGRVKNLILSNIDPNAYLQSVIEGYTPDELNIPNPEQSSPQPSPQQPPQM